MKSVVIMKSVFGLAFQLLICSRIVKSEETAVAETNNDPPDVLPPAGCIASLLLCNCNVCITVCLRDDYKTNRPFDYPPLEESLDYYPPRQTPSHLFTPGLIQLLEAKGNSTVPLNSSVMAITNTTKDDCGYSRKDAEELLINIEKVVLNFYARAAHKMNVRSDGGYGLRMLAGQLNSIVGKLDGVEKRNKNLQRFFRNLTQTSMKLSDVVMELAVANIPDESTHQGMKMVLEKKHLLHPKSQFRWKPKDIIESHFEEFENIGKDPEVIYPYLDFHCRIALVDSCDVPFVCKKIYLEDVYSQYMLLHQVMYLKYADSLGCIEKHPDEFRDHEKLLDRVCSKAYLEAEYLESHGFPTRYIDLFAEAVGFCGLAGYSNFARDDWLREIMSWQSPSDSGCFKDHYLDRRVIDAVVNVESTLDNGKTIAEDCMVHLNSVGLMALAVNLRRIVDTCPTEFWNEYEPRYWA